MSIPRRNASQTAPDTGAAGATHPLITCDTKTPRRSAWTAPRRSAWTALTAAALILTTATSAAADTSTATAQAASVTLLGGGLVASPTSSITNPGDQPVLTDASSGSTAALLPGQSLISGGALVQQTKAYSDGTSVACAALVGVGGSVSIGADRTCTTVNGSGGVTITLSALATITAKAITASCIARSDGTASATATLSAAKVNVAGLLPTTLDASTPNTGVNVAGIATLVLNQQSIDAGKATATALNVTLVGSTVSARIANVTCGANARTVPASAVPAKGIPLAAGVLGVAAVLGRHRLRGLMNILKNHASTTTRLH